MPSTYSTSLKIELIGNGEQTGTWGQTTNNNMGTLLEQAITGVGSLYLSGDYVLSNYNGLPDEARNAVLTFSGSLAAPANVVAPSVQKTYVVTNNAGANVTLKTSTGTGVVIQNGLSALVYCDGTEFYTAINVNSVVGDLSVSGNETIGGQINLGNSSISGAAGNLTMTANSSIIDMSGNTGAFVPPTGTVAQRPATPSLGMSRWNSDYGQYEIWNGLAWQVIASGTYNISYLVVGGGGGASPGNNGYTGGGGGAGGLLAGTGIAFTPGTTYTITVGTGGSGTRGGTYDVATAGSNSTISGSGFSTVNAFGGGAGGGYNAASAGSGGSGGGGWASGPGYGSGNGGSGTSGQGNAGGNGTEATPWGVAGGGGGSAGVGGTNNNLGGTGTTSTITGSSITYAAGGPSGGYGAAGTAYTGNGGEGGGYGNGAGGAGGSGVVILSVPTTNYSGVTTGSPTVTTNGAFTVLKYTTSGTYKA